MFALQHIHKSYDENVVLRDVSLSVNTGEVVALIGSNGVGKTTLLKIILGEVQPDLGTISLHDEVIGYVPQEATALRVSDCFATSIEQWQIDYALETVGLPQLEQDRKVASLSGGQKTRLAIAGVLVAEPSVLLLDEPTNNLDSESLVWLRKFVRSFRGSVLLVSHDRAFINDVATSVVDLRGGQLYAYGGNYELYKQQRSVELATEQQRYDDYLSEKKRLEQAISQQREKNQHVHKHIDKTRTDHDTYQRDYFRNRVTVKYGQQAKMLEGRLKQLDEVGRPESTRGYAVNLQGSVNPNKLLVRLYEVSFSYTRTIFEGLSIEVRGSDRLHITGVNGSGKTTLLRLLAGLSSPPNGERQLGANVQVGYFSQDVDGLDYRTSALENLQTTEASMTDIYRQARSLGLDQDDLQKMPVDLSRGQQAKLGFARLLLGAYHLLVLDEPTNHLDIATREQIEAALRDYKSAIVVASHDQYFVKAIGINQKLRLDKGVLS